MPNCSIYNKKYSRYTYIHHSPDNGNIHTNSKTKLNQPQLATYFTSSSLATEIFSPRSASRTGRYLMWKPSIGFRFSAGPTLLTSQRSLALVGPSGLGCSSMTSASRVSPRPPERPRDGLLWPSAAALSPTLMIAGLAASLEPWLSTTAPAHRHNP